MCRNVLDADKVKLYSPKQVGISSFVGGPFAAVFVLWKNFHALGNRSGATHTLMIGSLFTVVMFLVLPFLPEKFPSYAIPLAYSLGARFFAEKYQMSK